MSLLQFLIVEDDDNDVVLLQNALRRAGLEFNAQVVDHQAGFRFALEEQRPDLVIADFRLPRFDALAALEVLQHHARKTPFIVFAGGLDEETARLCLKLGAADCVAKQQPERLVAAVRAALERRRHVEEKAQAVRESEARFRLLAEAAPALLWRCDAEGRLLHFNPAWSEFTGITVTDEAGWTDCLHPEDRDRWHQLAAEQLALGQTVEVRLRLRRADGEFRALFCRATPIDDGRAGGFIGAALETSGAAPAPALRPGLRHEFNNRLAIIRMTAEMLAETPGLPPAVVQRAREIAESADHTCELVRELPSSAPPRVGV